MIENLPVDTTHISKMKAVRCAGVQIADTLFNERTDLGWIQLLHCAIPQSFLSSVFLLLRKKTSPHFFKLVKRRVIYHLVACTNHNTCD